MEDFLDFAEAAINHIRTVYPGSDEETREDLAGLAEQLLQYLIVVDSRPTCDSDLFSAVRRLVVAMTEQLECRGRGRPKVAIHKDQLQYLVEQGFRVKDISEMFMCCTRTIERKMKKYNIILRNYTPICDPDGVVKEITSLFPNGGEKTVSGRLKSYEILIKRERVREALRRVDPLGVRARCRSVLHRRVYSVPSPNALWHIDGYHKLI